MHLSDRKNVPSLLLAMAAELTAHESDLTSIPGLGILEEVEE